MFHIKRPGLYKLPTSFLLGVFVINTYSSSAQKTKIPKEQFEKLSQSLRLSDFVKFAKYIPSLEDDKNSFDTINWSIQKIEQLSINRVEQKDNKS